MIAPVILLLVLLGLGYVWLLMTLARRGQPAIDEPGRIVLRHSPLLRWFAIVTLFGGESLFTLGILLFPPPDRMTTALYTTGMVLLGVLGFLLLWESYRWQMTIRPGEWDCRSPWQARQVLIPEQVQSIHYSRVQGWYVIQAGSARFRVPAIVPGIQRWLDALPPRLRR